MTKTLVVVESPAKAKTIEKYLGGDYTVRASYGHIRDLPKTKLGVDLDHDFEPEYKVPEDSSGTSRELKKALKRDRGPDPRDGLRPRGRGDRLPRGVAARASTPARRSA